METHFPIEYKMFQKKYKNLILITFMSALPPYVIVVFCWIVVLYLASLLMAAL